MPWCVFLSGYKTEQSAMQNTMVMLLLGGLIVLHAVNEKSIQMH